MAHKKLQRRAAMVQARVLERRQLEEAGRNEQDSTEHRAGADQHHGKQRDLVQSPLHYRCEQAKPGPHDQVTTQERSYRNVGLVPFALPPGIGRKHQHHGRRGGNHHTDHHDGPHGETS